MHIIPKLLIVLYVSAFFVCLWHVYNTKLSDEED